MVFVQEIIYLKKDEVYAKNLDEAKSAASHLIALYVNGNNGSLSYNAIYLDSFGVEHIQKEIKKLIGNKSKNGNKNIITNIYRVQAYDLLMCGYFCVGFIDFMQKGKSLLDSTNLFSPNKHKKNDKMIL